MARQYKKNRARGSRAETYAEKIYLGYSLPKLSDYTTKEEYIKEFIKRNREELEKSLKKQLDEAYKAGGEEALTRAKIQFPNIKVFVTKTLGKNRITQKRVKSLISAKYANVSDKQALHIEDLMLADDSFWQELIFRIKEINPKESFKHTRLSYTGNSTYKYTTIDGSIIRFRFTSYSPAVLEFIGD